MKKTVICNISMKENLDQVIYSNTDRSLPVSDRKVSYPICAFLEKTMTSEDELDAILLVKKDKNDHYKKNIERFREELEAVNEKIDADISYTIIDSEFEEHQTVHEQLMKEIVAHISDNSHILADITYGPKDLPIVLFTTLSFAEKFLNCTVDNIVYGQASFENGRAVDTKICDMMPLYCLSSVTNTIQCTDPDKARRMFNTLLTF